MTLINPYTLPPLICAIIILTAGTIVLFKSNRAKLNQSFFTLCFSTATWLSFYGINSVPQNRFLSELFLRFDYCGVAFISITFLDYILNFLDFRYKKAVFLINRFYGLVLLFLILKTDLIVNGLYHFFWGYYPKAGKLHPIFLTIFLAHCMFGNFLVYRAYINHPLNTERSNQLKYLVLGFIVFTLACWDFLGNYGLELYPFGYVPATIFILIVFYAIIKHNLMDINIVINRSLVYSLLITTITIIYLLFVLLVERFSQNIFRYNSIIVSILTAFIIAIIFVPLKDWIQKFVDQFFFKKSHFELVDENQLLHQNAVDSEKMRTIATLSSGIAHEIRNPLTSLKTFVEYFPEKKNDPEFIAKFESIAGTEISRIESILNELLAFAKPSPLTLTDTDIKKTLEHALNLTANQLHKNNVEAKTEFSHTLPTVKADTNKLLQIFINLIINANEAMPNGGSLTVSTNVNDSINISFTDIGCGIPKENLNKIFEPFYSTKDTGTGLGLAIVKGIIEDHGGKITVESTKDQGTTFIITLPMTEVQK